MKYLFKKIYRIHFTSVDEIHIISTRENIIHWEDRNKSLYYLGFSEGKK